MQASTNVRQTPPGRRAGRGSSVLPLAVSLAVLAMLLLSLFAILEDGKPAQAIVGGTKVTNNAQYPFLAQLVYTDPKTKKQTVICGGTVIDKDSVLTAGHCVVDEQGNRFDPKQISVIVGTTKLNDTSQGQKLSVAKPPQICCGNGEYKGGSGPYDAAVLTLSQPVSLGQNVPPMQLATPAQKDSLEEQGDKATVAGWGRTAKGCPASKPSTKEGCQGSKELNKREVSIHSDFQLTQHKEAYVEASSGACQGDSGGPLFTGPDNKGRYTQIGIASAVVKDFFTDFPDGRLGGGCGGIHPDIYTEVNNTTIYNFITKAAGLDSANKSSGSNKDKGSGNNKDKGSGSNKGGDKQGGNTTGSGSSTGTDTTGTDTTTGSGSTTGNCEAGSPGCGGTTGGSGSTTGAGTTGSGGTTGADTTGSGSTSGGTTDPGSTTGGVG